jgi:hypothetical protein
MRFIGKIGARSSGPTGCPVPGCNGGLIGEGISAKILYHCLGISLSSKNTFTCSITPPSSLVKKMSVQLSAVSFEEKPFRIFEANIKQ